MTRTATLVTIAALLFGALSVWALERQRTGLIAETTDIEGTPVTIWRLDPARPAPLAVIAHGYAGSRQMMEPIALSLAHAGFAAASFDFLGHGRHGAPITADVTMIEGATAQLVAQTRQIAQTLLARPDLNGPAALIGHSMATDIVIRAAEGLGPVAGVIAISMYSDAVTPEHPQRLLVISGETEYRLREVALDRVRQVDPTAEEGDLATSGVVTRQAVSAPWVGHVGVLYASNTLDAVQGWLGTGAQTASGRGLWITALLGAIVALAWPLSRLIPQQTPAPPPGRATIWRAILLAPLPALGATLVLPAGPMGLSGFAGLAGFFGIWGAMQLAVLWRSGTWQPLFSVPAGALLLAWGLGVFAVALDHYGAAFLPVGMRLWVMGLLLVGTLPFCVADAALARGFSWPQWMVSRALIVATLLGAMVLTPGLATTFTVLPVLVLFWVVYGLAARWLSARAGAEGPGLALGIILAWAIAASTPLIGA
ncbi:MAG: alpha/beta hydrolase [Paracoccaceae bacterium]